MEENKQNEQVNITAPIIKPTETVEYLMTSIGQEVKKFELQQRKAQVYNSSSIVPKAYQGSSNLGNVIIALDMAERIKMNPLTVMQNLYIVYGNPGWSSKFLISSFNQCGKYTRLRYEVCGKQGTDQWGMRAYAYEIEDKKREKPLYGPWITIKIAKDEGWYSKQGSKWQTVPELMLRYRSAAWFINTTAPEISMGLPTREEIEDTREVVDADAVEVFSDVAMPTDLEEAEEVEARVETQKAKVSKKEDAPKTDNSPQSFFGQ